MVGSTPNSKHGRHNLWPLEQFFRHDDRPEVQNPSPRRTGTGCWILDGGMGAGTGTGYQPREVLPSYTDTHAHRARLSTTPHPTPDQHHHYPNWLA